MKQLEKNGGIHLDRADMIAMAVFLLVLGAYVLNAWVNYQAQLGNDHLAYHFGVRAILKARLSLFDPLQHLLENRFPNFRSLSKVLLPAGNGHLTPVTGPGISLVIAPVYALVGDQVFRVVPILWDVLLLIGLFGTVNFYLRPKAPRLALAGASLTVALYATVVNFRLSYRRDHAIAFIIMLVTLLLLRYSQTRKKRHLVACCGLATLAATIKITAVLFLLPLGLYLLSEFRMRASKPHAGRRVWLPLILSLAVSVIIAVPWFIHNAMLTGSPFLPGQVFAPVAAQSSVSSVLAPKTSLATALANIASAQAYVLTPNGLPRLLALVTVGLALAGFWFERRNRLFTLWMAPAVVLQYTFFVFWRMRGAYDEPYAYNIYLSPVYPLLFVAAGAALLHLAERSVGKRGLVLVAVVVAVPFVSVKAYRTLPSKRHHRFQLDESEKLRRDIESVIPAGAVVLVDEHLTATLEYYTHVRALSPESIGAAGVSVVRIVAFLHEQSIPVYWADYEGAEHTAHTLRRLEELNNFDSAIIRQRTYGMSGPSSEGYSIYRLVPLSYSNGELTEKTP